MSEERLNKLRSQIQELDRELVTLIGKRRDLAIDIGQAKGALGLPVRAPPQEAKVVRRAAEIARDLGVDEELTRDVIWRIIAAARDAQDGNNESGPTSIEVDEDTT